MTFGKMERVALIKREETAVEKAMRYTVGECAGKSALGKEGTEEVRRT